MTAVTIRWDLYDEATDESRRVYLEVLADCWGADPDVGSSGSISIEWAKIDGDGPDLSLSMSEDELDELRSAVWAKLDRGPEY